MSFERTLEGAVAFLDRSAKMMKVTQEGTHAGGAQQDAISFVLSPNVTVSSSTRGTVKLTALKTGQKVLVRYVTESGGRWVANTITLVESGRQPRAGLLGVQATK